MSWTKKPDHALSLLIFVQTWRNATIRCQRESQEAANFSITCSMAYSLVRESESRMYVAQLWPSACPCTLIVVPMRVLFPKKKENRSARFAKAATSSYLVDVSPTHSFARCVGLVGRLGLGRAHVRMDSSRLCSSSKPTSDPARSPTCVRLSV